jgi:hypothetical protein
MYKQVEETHLKVLRLREMMLGEEHPSTDKHEGSGNGYIPKGTRRPFPGDLDES